MHSLLENAVLGQTPFWKMKFSGHVSARGMTFVRYTCYINKFQYHVYRVSQNACKLQVASEECVFVCPRLLR